MAGSGGAMMLAVMPWCRIDREYLVGDVTITPYHGRLDGVDVVQRGIDVDLNRL